MQLLQTSPKFQRFWQLTFCRKGHGVRWHLSCKLYYLGGPHYRSVHSIPRTPQWVSDLKTTATFDFLNVGHLLHVQKGDSAKKEWPLWPSPFEWVAVQCQWKKCFRTFTLEIWWVAGAAAGYNGTRWSLGWKECELAGNKVSGGVGCCLLKNSPKLVLLWEHWLEKSIVLTLAVWWWWQM